MTLDDKVTVILVIAVYLAVARFLDSWNQMDSEYRKSEIESARLLVPLLGTILFTVMAVSGSGPRWAPLAAIVSLAALIYGVVRVVRRPPDP